MQRVWVECYNFLMGMERGETERLERDPIQSDLYDVVESLRQESFESGQKSIAQSPRTYPIKRTITPSGLESLGTLDFENTLYEFKNDLRLVTGSKESALPSYSQDEPSTIETARTIFKQLEWSRFTVHNHWANGRLLTGNFLAVSAGDTAMSKHLLSEVDFVVTRDGIIGYKPEETLKSEHWAFENPNRILKKQQEQGITRFFVPFRGDAESQKKLGLICLYMNDPSMHWESIREEVESEK